jgi:predicted RecA/RadA family phage recombinase
VEYGYDWKRMKRTKVKPGRVQQTSLDQCRPGQQVPPMGSADVLPESACGREQESPIARSTSRAKIKIWSAARLIAHAVESRVAAARRWSFSRHPGEPNAGSLGIPRARRRIRLPVIALVVFLAFTYVVARRSGRAVPEQKSPQVATTVEVAAHSETSIETAVSNESSPKAPPTPSVTDHHGGERKLKRILGVPRVQTPVLVAGEVRVTSQPDGAQVRFDGHSEPVFVTPAVVESIPPGHHSVVFSKPGFISQTLTVEVVAGVRSTVAARLVQKGSVFKISSNPAGAAILLDGKSTALTSPSELRVDVSGTHTITLVQPGFLAAQSQVSVRDGENFSVAFTLIPAGNVANSKVVGGIKRLLPGGSSKEMADVHFKTNPKGARVMLNGWSAPKTTPLELRLPPGGYDVVIQADGFKRFSKEIVLEAGKKVVLQEALERSTRDDRPAKP